MKYEKPVMDVMELQWADVVTLSSSQSGDDAVIEGEWGH